MRRIAKFHKVSEAQFLEGWKDSFPETQEQKIKEIYEFVKLPKRHLDACTCLLFISVKECGKHHGVVIDKQVAVVKIIDDFLELVMLDRTVLTVDHHQTGIVTFACL